MATAESETGKKVERVEEKQESGKEIPEGPWARPRLQCEVRQESVVRYISFVMVAVLVLNRGIFGQETPVSPVPQAQAQESAQTSTIKAAVQKRGVSQKARVRVKLQDGGQVVGRISKIDDAFFEVSNKAGETIQIQYTEVQKIGGTGLSKGAKIGIGVGVGLVVVGIVVAIKVATFHLGKVYWLCAGI